MTMLPLGTTRGLGRARLLSGERVVNLFAEKAPDGAAVAAVLRGVSGLESFASVGTGPIRGAIYSDGSLYAVSGDEVYSVARDGTATRVGGLPGTGPVLLASNGAQIMAQRTDATGAAYIVTSTGVTQITDADFPGSVSVAFLDSYFVCARPNSGQAFTCSPNDGASWDALDFATAESNPDRLVAVRAVGSYLLMLGEFSTEAWYAAGGTAFPFARAGGGRMDRGCISEATARVIAGQCVFLGDDKAVYATTGADMKRVSTAAVEAAIEADGGDLDDAFAEAWEEQGHSFYALTLADVTLVYDLSTGLWHERESADRRRWIGRHLVRAYGENYCADAEGSAVIYRLTPDAYDEDGDPLRRYVVTAPVENDRKRLFFDSLELACETGTAARGDSPEAALSWSDDGGATWGSFLTRGLGETGQRQTRVLWKRLGSGRRRSFRIETSAAMPVTLFGFVLQASAGEN